jgi:nonribosomal peptide synthetase DhbF
VSRTAIIDDFGVILPLREQGNEPPLFCLHPGFALCWTYARLLRRLGSNQPVYGIQARGITDDGALPASFDELVTDYLEQIRLIRQHGPYRFIGWSFGGLVAHALATRLQAEGERVDTLALMDTILEIDDDLDTPEQLAQIHLELDAVRDTVPDPDRLLQIVLNLNRLRPEFVPGRFDGDALIFTAAQEPDRPTSIAQEWVDHVIGQVREYLIPCTHLTMMTAGPAQEIGTILAEALRALPGEP